MTLRQADIAAVVNLHTEGDAALPSLVSSWRAAEHARAAGISVELAIVLDSPDAETIAVANAWSDRARIIPIAVGDLGAARNAAVRTLDGEWMAFLDGDDLWGESWLTGAFTAATSTDDPTPLDVWHPQVNVMFGATQSLLHHRDSTDPSFSIARLRLFNAWTALSFTRREYLELTPYPRNRLAEGFGYEDWSWNVEVLRRGGRHRIVPDSVHAIYRAPAGPSTNLLSQSRAALRSPYPDPASLSAVLAWQTVGVSELSPTEPDLPPQFRHLPVELSDAVYGDVWRAATIAPAIRKTIEGPGHPDSLPQNFNEHVTAAQRALEELDLAAQTDPGRSLGQLLEIATLVHQLSADDQARVVAECILNPIGAPRDRGISPLIDEAITAYPQLREQR